MASPRETIEFLARSPHRLTVLDELFDGPKDRVDLRAATGASDPTIGRILGDFDSRGWTRRAGHNYTLTQPGQFVAEHFLPLLDRMETEQRLREVWRWLPHEFDGFSFEMVADATVTMVEPGDPYAPANRCLELYRGSERVRGFDAAVTAPHHFEEVYQRIVDGMEAEIIFPRNVSMKIATAYPEKAIEAFRSDHLTLRVTDDLPLYRLLIFDDRVGIGGYHPETGVLQGYVDTDVATVREWANSTYESFRCDSQPLSREQSSP